MKLRTAKGFVLGFSFAAVLFAGMWYAVANDTELADHKWEAVWHGTGWIFSGKTIEAQKIAENFEYLYKFKADAPPRCFEPGALLQHDGTKWQCCKKVSGGVDTKVVSDRCKRGGSNAGCEKIVQCPSGYLIKSIRAACNLEFGNTSLNGVPWDMIKVTRASDYVSSGVCGIKVNGQSIVSLSSGTKQITNIPKTSLVSIYAREHDRNGGDVDMQVELKCEKQLPDTYTCDYGIQPETKQTYTKVDECKVSGSNAGCSKTFSCRSGYVISKVRLACNLEFGNTSLSGVAWNTIKVTRASDYVSNGECGIRNLASIRSGVTALSIPQDWQTLVFYAREHDRNGGDVHAKIEVECKEK